MNKCMQSFGKVVGEGRCRVEYSSGLEIVTHAKRIVEVEYNGRSLALNMEHGPHAYLTIKQWMYGKTPVNLVDVPYSFAASSEFDVVASDFDELGDLGQGVDFGMQSRLTAENQIVEKTLYGDFGLRSYYLDGERVAIVYRPYKSGKHVYWASDAHKAHTWVFLISLGIGADTFNDCDMRVCV